MELRRANLKRMVTSLAVMQVGRRRRHRFCELRPLCCTGRCLCWAPLTLDGLRLKSLTRARSQPEDPTAALNQLLDNPPAAGSSGWMSKTMSPMLSTRKGVEGAGWLGYLPAALFASQPTAAPPARMNPRRSGLRQERRFPTLGLLQASSVQVPTPPPPCARSTATTAAAAAAAAGPHRTPRRTSFADGGVSRAHGLC